MRQLIVYLLMLSTFGACIDRVELPVRTEEPRLVVEGQLTNEAPPYTVRLTYTGKYGGANGQNPADQYVSGAQVSLADDQGRSTGFKSVGQGLYQTEDKQFRGQIGRAYSLTIVLTGGKRYVSEAEQMPSVPAIDSLYPQLARSETSLNPYSLYFYAVTKDPPNQLNYYRWSAKTYSVIKCYGGYYWAPGQNTSVNILSDEPINGSTFRQFVLKSPVYSTGPHFVEVNQYAITRSAYQFWTLYEQQNARTGSIFDPLPAPVTGNLVNVNDPTDKARGFFEVYATTVKRIRFYDTNAVLSMGAKSFIASIEQNGLLCNTPGLFPLLIDPPGF